MTRPPSIAEIFQLGYYWEAKVLLTSVKLDLYSTLAAGSLQAQEVARRLATDERATTCLLNALVAIGLLTKRLGRYENTPTAQEHLVTTSPRYLGDLLILQDLEWTNWGQLENIMRTGRSPVQDNVFLAHPETARLLTRVLHRMALQHAPALAKTLDLGTARTLLDLGGGAGTYAVSFCQAFPTLKAVIFDLHETLQTTQEIIRESGMAERIALRAGDFRTDDLGGPYDVVFMSDILHYQDPTENLHLVERVYRSLAAGGRIIIKDKFLDEEGTKPAWTAAFAVHLLVQTERGRCYPMQEAMDWMGKAGFQAIRELEHTTVLVGEKL